MEKAVCSTCQSEKTALRCGLCSEPSCKSCAHLLGEDAFSFLPTVPEEMTKGVYCHPCYIARIADSAEAYDRTMEAAHDVDVYFSKQGKETRLIPRTQIKYKIDACDDRDELILRFAFRAVLDGYSTLVDVDIIAEKIRDGARQQTNYRGTAVPANARPEHIIRDKSIRDNPN